MQEFDLTCKAGGGIVATTQGQIYHMKNNSWTDSYRRQQNYLS